MDTIGHNIYANYPAFSYLQYGYIEYLCNAKQF